MHNISNFETFSINILLLLSLPIIDNPRSLAATTATNLFVMKYYQNNDDVDSEFD
jgi:hypothetical protein